MKQIVIGFFCLFSLKGLACSCGTDYSLKNYLDRCKSVYTARVISSKYIKDKSITKTHFSDGKDYHYPYIRGKLSKPIKVFKGKPRKTSYLETTGLGTSCNYGPAVGHEYLVCSNSQKYMPLNYCGLTIAIEGYEFREHYESFIKQYENESMH